MATAAVSLVVGVASHSQQRKANKQNKKAQRVQERRAAAENAMSRRSNIAAARRARAQTIAQGTAQGVGGGSSTQGAAGSAISTGAGAVSFQNQLEGFDKARFGAISAANKAYGNIAAIQSAGDVAQTFVGEYRRYKKLNS